jgi:hypothetical protein
MELRILRRMMRMTAINGGSMTRQQPECNIVRIPSLDLLGFLQEPSKAVFEPSTRFSNPE